jgi:hypothetical protein
LLQFSIQTKSQVATNFTDLHFLQKRPATPTKFAKHNFLSIVFYYTVFIAKEPLMKSLFYYFFVLLCMITMPENILCQKKSSRHSEPIKLETPEIIQPLLADESAFKPEISMPQLPKSSVCVIPETIVAIKKPQDFDLFSYFLRPINFSTEGIGHYFKYTYNHEKYTEYLPYNLSHMIQFLEFGKNCNQTEAYAKSIIKLFMQKIKGCEFMNSYNLVTSMPKIADSLEPFMIKKETTFLQEVQKSLKDRFSSIFSNYFSYFQKNPDAFLDALSEQIAKKTNEMHTQQHIDVEHIKKDVLRFLELCINKLIWSPNDAYEAWISINEIATQADYFLRKKLLTDVDALDDLYWSLIYRFTYFLDIAHEHISEETLIQIVQEIHTEKLLLFMIEEQEDVITTKKEFLLQKIKNYTPYTYQPKKDFSLLQEGNFQPNSMTMPSSTQRAPVHSAA